MFKYITLIIFLVAFFSCSSTKTFHRSDTSSPQKVITKEEFSGLTFEHAHEIIRKLRPEWLRNSTNDLFNREDPKRVYINDVEENYTSLGMIPPALISKMEYLEGTEATERFGSGHSNGAILITTTQDKSGRLLSDSENRIVNEEFANLGVNSVYEVIERLRPMWLQFRSDRNFPIRVYVNNFPEDLRALMVLYPDNVFMIEYLSPTDATILYGASHVNGAILVKTY